MKLCQTTFAASPCMHGFIITISFFFALFFWSESEVLLSQVLKCYKAENVNVQLYADSYSSISKSVPSIDLIIIF